MVLIEERQEGRVAQSRDVVLSVRDVTVGFGDTLVLDGLSLDVYRGEILGFVGASGAGKSVLLRTILGLVRKRSGTIHLLGQDLDAATDEERLRVDMHQGVLFQHGALFSALTVLENIQVPMREYLDLPRALMDELAKESACAFVIVTHDVSLAAHQDRVLKLDAGRLVEQTPAR